MDADALKEWHRYVDSVSRPCRRFMDAPPEEHTWRPWMEEPAPDSPAESVRADELPDLSAALSMPGMTQARVTASRSFEDPTIHDELPSRAEHALPQLVAPAFEIRVPAFDVSAINAPWERASVAALAALVPEPPPRLVPAPAPAVSAATRARSDVDGTRRRARVRSRSREELVAQLRQEAAPTAVDPTLTLEEAATLLGVCSTTIRRYTNRGQLIHFRTTGNQRRFRLSDLNAFMQSRTAAERAADDAEARREEAHEK